MALAKEGVMIAPSTDGKTQAELNSVKLQSGMYNCMDQVEISYTDEFGKSQKLSSNLWTVFCISSNNLSNLLCYTQIWVCTACQTNDIFVRTLKTDATGYTEFSKLVDMQYLKDNIVINTHTEPVHVVVSNTQPTAEAGITKLWIDTSGS